MIIPSYQHCVVYIYQYKIMEGSKIVDELLLRGIKIINW